MTYQHPRCSHALDPCRETALRARSLKPHRPSSLHHSKKPVSYKPPRSMTPAKSYSSLTSLKAPDLGASRDKSGSTSSLLPPALPVNQKAQKSLRRPLAALDSVSIPQSCEGDRRCGNMSKTCWAESQGWIDMQILDLRRYAWWVRGTRYWKIIEKTRTLQHAQEIQVGLGAGV